jgi:hypothetical protein
MFVSGAKKHVDAAELRIALAAVLATAAVLAAHHLRTDPPESVPFGFVFSRVRVAVSITPGTYCTCRPKFRSKTR